MMKGDKKNINKFIEEVKGKMIKTTTMKKQNRMIPIQVV